MAISQAMCTSFKVELLQGKHNFSSASLGASTTDYSTSNEASGTNYSAGGSALTSVTPTSSGTTALCDFSDLTFSSATVTARGGLIYNTTTGGGSSTTDAVIVLDFGGDKTSTAGDFTIQFPTADASNAIIRIA
jgi:hypothetical protein